MKCWDFYQDDCRDKLVGGSRWGGAGNTFTKPLRSLAEQRIFGVILPSHLPLEEASPECRGDRQFSKRLPEGERGWLRDLAWENSPYAEINKFSAKTYSL